MLLEEDDANLTDLPDYAGMLEGVEGDILDLMKKTKAVPENFREHLEAFVAAINWKETWIRILLASHVVFWLVFFVTRRWPRMQTFLFILITVLVGGAESLNSFCAKNWKKFATQNYFDREGVFAGIMFCAPLLALGFAMLANFLLQASDLLVQVKRREIQDNINNSKRKNLSSQQGEDQSSPEPDPITKKEQ
uniref:Transmembrane protein 18 n=1 Tax=Aureoumbra lagunensis TaxID=44058 RepID=A0A7S3NGQ9_9STRA|mmetsp:Transcript_7927/g.12057  ORF Transcript_7927/g.12057 Transcript_7927/m.12057 type:complete len:193 (+) Transcript_7927:35-613(+)